MLLEITENLSHIAYMQQNMVVTSFFFLLDVFGDGSVPLFVVDDHLLVEILDGNRGFSLRDEQVAKLQFQFLVVLKMRQKSFICQAESRS